MKRVVGLFLFLLASCGAWADTLVHTDVPPFQIVVDSSTGATWTALTAYNPRSGGGSFEQWFSPNLAGNLTLAVITNSGLIDATTGAEQGDWELYIPHLGVMFDGSGQGYGLEFDGVHQAFFPTRNAQIDLGYPSFPWRSLYVTSISLPLLNCPASARALGTTQCVAISGGFVPVFH